MAQGRGISKDKIPTSFNFQSWVTVFSDDTIIFTDKNNNIRHAVLDNCTAKHIFRSGQPLGLTGLGITRIE